MNQTQVPHMLANKHILLYVKRTKNLDLYYKQGDSYILTRHADAEWTREPHDGKSST